MGTPLFPFALTLLAAVTAAPDPQVMREERFQSVLAEMDLAAAEQACRATPASPTPMAVARLCAIGSWSCIR